MEQLRSSSSASSSGGGKWRMLAAGGCSGCAGILLLTRPSSINFHQKLRLPLQYSIYHSHQYILQRCCLCISRNSRRKDSNADNVWFRDKNTRYGEEEDEEDGGGGYRRKRKKRKWLSGEPPAMSDEEEESTSEIFEEFVDSLWILKVFKSYGWALPPIIISWLLATGPKAFLMTLALPLGQSAITFVFNKLWETIQNKPKRKPRRRRRRRKPFVTGSDVQDSEQEPVEQNESFQSWIGKDDDDGYGSKERQEASSYFGGWDELDGVDYMRRRMGRTGQSQSTPSGDGKLGKRESKSDVPLLLRLLIAVFPFLDSWTKLL